MARSRHGIFISQQKYIQDILQEVGMTGCKPMDTPIESNHRLGEQLENEEPVDK